MKKQTTDKFNLTKQDYKNVLTAITNVYGSNNINRQSIAFSDTDVEYELASILNTDENKIDNKFFAFFEDLMNAMGADLNENFDGDTWVNADDTNESISVESVYNVIKNEYPK